MSATASIPDSLELRLFSQPLAHLVTRLTYFRRLERLWRVIESRFAEPDLSLVTAAQACGVSKNHLNVLLQRVVAHTFYSLLVRYRLFKSLAMMRERNYSILEIALANGFGSLSSFERNFKKLMGTLPSEFRGTILDSRLADRRIPSTTPADAVGRFTFRPSFGRSADDRRIFAETAANAAG